MRRTLILSAVWAGLSGPALSSPAFAQRDEASKNLGDPYYFYAAKNYGNHAADHVHILRQFISANRLVPFPTEWFGQHVAAVRSNVASTDWAYSELSSPVKEQPEGAEQLAEIRQQYADVLKICDRLDAACAEPAVNVAVVSRTLDELQSTLSGARASQQELAFCFGGPTNWQGDPRATPAISTEAAPTTP